MYLGFLTTLVFPTLVTAIYFILYFTPIGDIVSPSYSQIDNTSVMMVSENRFQTIISDEIIV